MACFLCGCSDRLVAEASATRDVREVYCKRCDVFTPVEIAKLHGIRLRVERELRAEGYVTGRDARGRVVALAWRGEALLRDGKRPFVFVG